MGCRVRTLEEALIYIVHPTKLVTIKASHKRVAEVIIINIISLSDVKLNMS